MTQWEYLTMFLEADARREEDYLTQLRDWKNGMPIYTPEALMPRLNSLGEQGWELVTMQPVYVGNNADILAHDNSSNRWTRQYFCVFKREVVDSN